MHTGSGVCITRLKKPDFYEDAENTKQAKADFFVAHSTLLRLHREDNDNEIKNFFLSIQQKDTNWKLLEMANKNWPANSRLESLMLQRNKKLKKKNKGENENEKKKRSNGGSKNVNELHIFK